MSVVFVSPAKQKRDIYCFSGIVGGGCGGVNFCWVYAFRSFSQGL